MPNYQSQVSQRPALLELLQSSEKLTYSEMGQRLGVSRQRIHQLINALGLREEMQEAKERRLKLEAETFERYRSGQIDFEEVEQILGLEASLIKARFRRRGLCDNWHSVESQHRLARLQRERFGLWQVIGVPEQDLNAHFREMKVTCRCECGVERDVLIHNLQNGYSRGCHSCSAKSRKSTRWHRADGQTFKTMTEAAKDAGVTPATISAFRRRNGAKPYVSARNGHRYAPVGEQLN